MPETPPPKLPNFILAGAPTSGTTSLYHYLCQHPQVYMCPIKEPTFFAADDILARADLRPMLERQRPALQAYLEGRQRRREQVWVTNWDDYVRLFQDVRGQTAIGEASVSYIWLPSAAPAIRSKLPGMRLIFLLRDPTERLFSAYLATLSHKPDVTFRAWVLRAMQMGPDRRQSISRHPIPLDGGLYATHLKRFLDLFPSHQVRIHLYESYRTNPRAVLGDILVFLGVDPHQPIDMSQWHNETLVPRFPAVAGLRQRVLSRMHLPAWFPAPVVDRWRKFYYRRKSNFTLSPDDRRLVIDYYRDEILRTQDLIGMDLSAWLR